MAAKGSDSSEVRRIKAAVVSKLLPWFSANARPLPWRKNRTPYRVWVAEVMLQQTRVDPVIPYYNRWMKRFPSWKALAQAPQRDVLKCWEGLGYYSRARNLHAAAKIIRDQFNGRLTAGRKKAGLPWEPFLQTLPGVGRYTAAAIASLAFNADAAVVDGNVIRVLSRLFADAGDVKNAAGKKKMQERADALLIEGQAGLFNEAMMELGALICIPSGPKCAACPMKGVCVGFAEGDPGKYPVSAPKKKLPHITVGAAVTVNRKGEVLIAQRRESDMLGGLWEFPGGKQEPGESVQECIVRELNEELGVQIQTGRFLMTVQHAYSHFTMTLHVYTAKIVRGRPRPLHCAAYAWVRVADLETFPFSRADLQVVEKLSLLQEEGVRFF